MRVSSTQSIPAKALHPNRRSQTELGYPLTMVSRTRSGGIVQSNGFDPAGFTQEFKARIFLLFACLWPLWVLALYGASAPQVTPGNASTGVTDPGSVAASHSNRLNLRNVLDRVDVMGYGPTHPRIAVVIVGEEKEHLKSSVGSVLQHTDLNRIFLICAVLDGHERDAKLIDELVQMDRGSVPHWHGLRMDIHPPGAKASETDEESHSRKIEAMFHPDRVGVAAARSEAVEFIQLLEQKHIQAGLKSPEEDLIVLFMSAGSQLKDVSWLQHVTNALIVPPPILQGGDEDVALKLANAVSLRLEQPGKATSFDEKLAPMVSAASAADINMNSGQSYPTPAFNGAGFALRLDTFVNLPAQDASLVDPWPADLDLALNLWLCADGIDIVWDVEVATFEPISPVPLNADLAARFAAVWMDDAMQQKFFQAYSKRITRLDWETKMQRAKRSSTFPKGNIAKRCRSFEWYAQNVNTDLHKVLEQVSWEEAAPKKPKKAKIADKKAQKTANEVPKTDKVKQEEKQDEEQKQAGVKADEHPKEAAEQQEETANDAKVANQKEPNAEQVHRQEQEHPKDPVQDAKPAEEQKAGQKEQRKESKPVEQQKQNESQHLELEKKSGEKHEEHHEPPQQKGEDEESTSDSQEEPHDAAKAVETEKKKPRVPLRKENLEIIQKATPMDISFVNVAGAHNEHPHMGAKDADGNWGYIHDEAALHNNPPPFEWEEDQEKEGCTQHDNNYKMMTKRVVVDLEYDKKQEESDVQRDKIFCLVYTIESGHDKIPNIRETWGSKCDGFMVGSTKTDVSIGAVEIPHEGPEEYNNIWQKVRSMWSYIYDNYYEKYDWFHIGGDDLYLIVENLRYYLESEEIRTAGNGGIYLPDGSETKQTPLLLGRRFAYQGDMEQIFDSGGSGYTMNKAALKALVVDGFPNYFPHRVTFSEDTMVALLFRKMNVFPYDTKDEDGGERYMPFMPGHHWGYHLPKDPNKDWYAKYSIDIKEGPEHCSPRSVAFHYVKGNAMKRLHALAYHLCSEQYMKQ